MSHSVRTLSSQKTPNFRFPSSKFAVLVVDMQDGVVKSMTHPHGLDKGLCHLAEVLKFAKDHGIEIIFIENHASGSVLPILALDASPRVRYFPKNDMNAFTNPALLGFLTSQGISLLLVTGYNYPSCVYHTVLGAQENGLSVVISEDLLFGDVDNNPERVQIARRLFVVSTEHYQTLNLV